MKALMEKRLVRVLAQGKAVEDSVLRVAQEKDTYRSLNMGTKMDLFVSDRNKTVVYEVKKAGSRALNVYQLRMYWDGQPITHGVLIARHHSQVVLVKGCYFKERFKRKWGSPG